MDFFSQGDIIWMNFNPQAGHEQAGRRPALVVSTTIAGARTRADCPARYPEDG